MRQYLIRALISRRQEDAKRLSKRLFSAMERFPLKSGGFYADLLGIPHDEMTEALNEFSRLGAINRFPLKEGKRHGR